MATILLADDSGTTQRMGVQILSAEGHDVKTVSDGQAAIQMLSQFSPDLILADVFMPGKTGYQVCEFVKSNAEFSRIPVLLIVAPMEPYDATEGKRVKADGLVIKPLDKSNLIETVQSLLASTEKLAAPESEPRSEPSELHESSREKDPAISTITSRVTAEFDIAEELKNQPIRLGSEPLEPEPVEAEPSAREQPLEPEPVEMEPSEHEEMSEEPSPLTQLENEPSATVPDLVSSRLRPVEPEDVGRTFAKIEDSPEEQPSREEPESRTSATLSQEIAGPETPVPSVPVQESASTPEPSWTGDPAEGPEDGKKFSGPHQDWQGLATMVQETHEDGQFAAGSSAGAEVGSAIIMPAEGHLSEEAEPAADPPSVELKTIPQSTTEEKTSPARPEPASSADRTEMMFPQVAPLDYATVEQIVRETIEGVLPQIVERIATATGMQFPKDED